MQTIIESFTKELKSEEKSANTKEKYVRDVKAFVRIIAGNEITKETVIEYKQYLLGKGYAKRSKILCYVR